MTTFLFESVEGLDGMLESEMESGAQETWDRFEDWASLELVETKAFVSGPVLLRFPRKEDWTGGSVPVQKSLELAWRSGSSY